MSLFKRPTWAKAQTDNTTEQPANLFSHNRSYREIVAEQEQKKQASLARKKAKEERRSSGKHNIKSEQSGESSNKRRRISVEEDDDDDVLYQNNDPLPEPDSRTNEEVHVSVEDGLQIEKPYIRRSPRKNKHVDTEHSPRSWERVESADVVDLGDSDTEDSPPMKHRRPLQAEVVEEESDDEFAELARRARQQSAPEASKKDQDEPAVQIFVTSQIPNTNPLLVWRRLSQNIAEIRKVWCQKQKFSEEATKEIFFIHRMRRVYDVTTCRSLGLEVDPLGNITLKGNQGNPLENVDKVHLEAVTEGIFRSLKEMKAQEEQRRNGELQAEAGAEDDQQAAQEPKEEPVIRLLLKAKGKEDFKLKVKATTTISKIIAAFGKTHLTKNESAYLEFDGDRLNPDDEIQNTEISDMDCVHVHITPSG